MDKKAFLALNAGVAHTIIITAKLIENDEEKGISAFIVESNTDGLTLG